MARSGFGGGCRSLEAGAMLKTLGNVSTPTEAPLCCWLIVETAATRWGGVHVSNPLGHDFSGELIPVPP